MDTDNRVYQQWTYDAGSGSAPYPLQAVLDADGYVTYLSRTHDPEAVRAALDAALAK